MDECPIILERLIPLMNDLIGKLQTFDTLITNETKSSAIRGICTKIEDLRCCLNNSIIISDSKSQIFKNQIERLFSEFNWNVNYTIKSSDHPKFIDCCKSLAASIMKILGKKTCGILVLEMYFQICIKLINELTENVEKNANVLKDLLLFQLLVKGFLSSLRVLKKFWYVAIPPHQKCSVLLCFNQSFKTLCILGKVIDKRLTHMIIYLLNRLKQCFNKTLDLLFNSEEEFRNSEFITLMDMCLNKLDHVGYEMTFQEDSEKDLNEFITSLKPLLDELLCHAMTVSHISNKEAVSGKIKSYSQKVLQEFEKVKNCENDFVSTIEKLSDVLCGLEETVNNAILNLVLDVFIDINEPLRNLVDKCNVAIEGSKSANDLENDISKFDDHLDRIMHIGLFAVSCSTDVKKILQIRSCLASLESLEAELITSIISIYLNANPESRSTFQYIFKNWLEEVTELKTLIDLIIDPAAFCRVVQKRIIALLYEITDDEPPLVPKIRSNVTSALSYTKKLIKTLWKSIENDDEEVKSRVKVFIEGLQLAYQECKTSCSLLDQEIPAEDISRRIIKRVELIVKTLNNLIRSYSDCTNASLYFEDEIIDNVLPRCDLDMIDMYRLSAVTPEPESPNNADILTPYIDKGKLKSKERTILYNTPKNTQQFQRTPKVYDLQIVNETRTLRKSFRSRCCRTLSRNLELENSLDLELTELLDNMTDLSNTFKTEINDEFMTKSDQEMGVSMTPELNYENSPDANVFLGTVMKQKLDQSLNDLSKSESLSIDKDSDYQLETPERMNDLNFVQKKINFLIEHMKD